MTNKEFKSALFKNYKQERYVKLIRLDANDLPIEEIEGKATGGSINVDGASSVRRTCSLTMITDDISQEYNWALSTKVKILVGLTNDIDPSRPAIVWFKQGIYYLTSFSASLGINSQSISLSGKDKMVKLNGELGGRLMQQTVFDNVETARKDENGNDVITHDKVPIKTIIYKAVQQFGGESPQNIIIDGLDEYGLELLENRSNEILYLARITNSEIYTEIIRQSNDKPCWKREGNNWEPTYISQINYDSLLYEGFEQEGQHGDIIRFKDENTAPQYYVSKVDYGELAGYKQTILYYPADLICNVGDTVTSMLDKLCSFLGVFEYFYDLDGRFIFQRKPFEATVAQELLAEEDGVTYVSKPLILADEAYELEDSTLLTQISRSPQISNIANDYSLWSNRNGVPIHIRYAIDRKPETYKTLAFNVDDWEVYKKASGMTFETSEEEDVAKNNYLNLISYYQNQDDSIMNLDLQYLEGYKNYFLNIKGCNFDTLYLIVDYYNEPTEYLEFQYTNYDSETSTYDFFVQIAKSNKEVQSIEANTNSHEENDTYSNLEVFFNHSIEYNSDNYDWRELIYRMSIDWYKGNYLDDFAYRLHNANNWCLNGRTGYEQYYEDINYFWPMLYNIEEPYVASPALITSGKIKNISESDEDLNLYALGEDTNTYSLYAPGEDTNIYSLYAKYNLYDANKNILTSSTYGILKANDDITIYDDYIIGYDSSIDITKQSSAYLYTEDTPIEFNKKHYYPRLYKAIKRGALWYTPIEIETSETYDEQIGTFELVTSDPGDFSIDKYYELDTELMQYFTFKEILIQQGIPEEQWSQWDSYEDWSYMTDVYKLNIYMNYQDLNDYGGYCEKTYGWASGKFYYLDDNGNFVRDDGDVPVEGRQYYLQLTDIYEVSFGPWRQNLINEPDQLVFWFDFIDDRIVNELTNMSVKKIGQRPYAKTDNDIGAIYYKQAPYIIYDFDGEVKRDLTGYAYIQARGYEGMFSISSKKKTAIEAVETLIAEKAYNAETISFSMIPDYSLDVNTRARIKNEDLDIDGEYVINKLTIPLNYNGVISVQASLAPTTLYDGRI